MKITAITPHYFHAELADPISDARNTITHRSCVLVQVDTDEGITGWGEAASFAGCGQLVSEVIRFFEKRLIGQDPLKVMSIYDECYHATQHFGRRGLVINALSGIDIALWDITGKSKNEPVYQILGASRDEIQFYFNSGYYVADDNLGFLKNAVTTAVEKGSNAIKIKIGRFGLDDDIKRIESAREILGDKRDLMVDANACLEQRYLKLLDPTLVNNRVRWMEEPVPLQDIATLKKVKKSIKTPIAGYELEQTLAGYKVLIENHVIDVVQPDSIWSGGITECQRITEVARQYSIEFVPHNFATIISLAANAHVAAHAPTGGWLEIDSNWNPFLWSLDPSNTYQLNDGKIALPDIPGIGVTPDLSTIDQYRIEDERNSRTKVLI